MMAEKQEKLMPTYPAPLEIEFSPAFDVYKKIIKPGQIPRMELIRKGDFNFSIHVSKDLLESISNAMESSSVGKWNEYNRWFLENYGYKNFIPVGGEIFQNDGLSFISIGSETRFGGEMMAKENSDGSKTYSS